MLFPPYVEELLGRGDGSPGIKNFCVFKHTCIYLGIYLCSLIFPLFNVLTCPCHFSPQDACVVLGVIS